jgi:hypothetical protein
MLLAAAVVALGAAAVRVASLAAPRGLERALSAAALGVAAAVVEVLLLGLLGLGGSSLALGAAVLATWVAARRLPAPELPVLVELGGWWSGLPFARRAVAGAIAGAWLVWQGWLLRHPALGFDTVLYHLSDAAVWAGHGHTGRTDLVIRAIPVTNYPVTDEVFLSWGLGLARSLVPASILVPPQVVLLGAAAWCGLRTLELPRHVCALATAALCSLPAVIAWQSNGSAPDPPSLAWLVTCGALCSASRRRAALLAPAVVAGGLAIGTKTTTAPLALALLAWAVWLHRARLRALWRPLALAVLLAVGCGGVWYLRNLLDHGSPLWPFVAAPWGTPLPHSLQAANESFAQHPRETIEVVGDYYTSRFLGGIVLLAGALVAPLMAWRRRGVWIASAAAVLSFLIWSRAPFTGVPPVAVRIPEGVFSTTRYLLPALAAAVLALALAAAGRGAGAVLARLVLAAATVIELIQGFRLGFPAMPSVATPLVGAAGGALLVGAAGALGSRRRVAARRLPRPVARAAPAAAAIALGALLAVPASGYLRRHAEAKVFASGVSGWMARRPDDSRPVASAPIVVGTLAGDRLRRRLEPIPRNAGCADVRARAEEGYVVLYVGAPRNDKVRSLDFCLGRPPSFRDDLFHAWAPAP